MEFSTLNGYKVKDKKAIRYYDTVADMKSDTTLKNGMYVKTKGYYESEDGGSAEYIIVNDNTLVDDGGSIHGLTNGLRAKLIIDKSEINAMQFGIKGNGTFDDSIPIQNAINTACSYIIEKTSSTGSFSGPIKIFLPNIKMYIKTRIESNEAITIEGSGVNSTLVLSDDIDYMIKIKKDTNTKTTNEETHIEGGGIKNIRFDGMSRLYSCTSAVYVGHIDHFILENLYFMCIKGKCIELEGAREGIVNNIFTRFCGVYGSGNIEIIPNSVSGGDTSNLSIGNNWNIVFPFGNAIKFDTGEIKYINNVIIHGMFNGIINSLETYFGSNDYEDENNDFIYLNNSHPNISNLQAVYCPDKSLYLNIINSNDVSLSNVQLQTHKSTQESHGGYGNFIKLSNNSIIYLNDVKCTMGSQDGDIFVVDSTSKVYGHISNQNESYLNTDIENFVRTNKFTIEGEKAQPVRFGYGKAINFKTFNTNCRANIVFGQSNPETSLQAIQPDALYIGTNQYRSRAVVGIPDDAYLVLPQVTGNNLSYINHTIFFDENNNLKVNIYNPTTQGYETKTIKFE